MSKFKNRKKGNEDQVQEEEVKGKKGKKPLHKRWWVWLIGIFLLIGMAGGGDTEGEEDSSPEEVEVAESTEDDTEEAEEEEEIEEVEEEPEPEEDPEEDIEEEAEVEEIEEIEEIEEPEEEPEEYVFEFDPEDYRTDLTYNDLARTDDHMFESVKFTGTVVQIMQGSGYNQMRMAIDDDYDRMILVEYDPDDLEYRLMEDDWIDIYGYSFGMVSYETVLGAEMSIPAIVADQVDLRE